MTRIGMLCMVTALSLSGGCFPGVRVIKNPGQNDTGVRYYRPKPYLLLQPVSEGEFNDQHVAISMEYLPDFSEEYSIRVRSGFGSANVQVNLDQGWNLTAINQQLDSQTDEIIGAVGEAVGNIAKVAAGGGGGDARIIVRASNVPLGYYEAVINRGAKCAKRLYGFRYVGFLPYAFCPTDVYGGDNVNCNDLPTPIYGLVYENGTLTFKPLSDVPNTKPEIAAFASDGMIELE